MNKIAEALINLAARIVLPIITRVESRREAKNRPALDYKLETLSIDEAVRKAREDLEARRKKARDES